MGRAFANGPGDQGSILGHVTPKTLKMVLNTSLLNTQVRIKGKVVKSGERSSALPLHLGVVAIEKETLRVALNYGRLLEEEYFNSIKLNDCL